MWATFGRWPPSDMTDVLLSDQVPQLAMYASPFYNPQQRLHRQDSSEIYSYEIDMLQVIKIGLFTCRKSLTLNTESSLGEKSVVGVFIQQALQYSCGKTPFVPAIP